MKVIKPGSSVIIGDSIPGKVVNVLIESNNGVSYKVAWWDNNVRKLEWLEEFEVKLDPIENKELKIGFRRNQ